MTEQMLIAGGAGFIGRHLATALALQGHSVTIADNFCTSSRADSTPLTARGIAVIDCDVQAIPFASYDVIYHLASPASPVHYQRLAMETMWANALGTRHLLDLARTCDARFVLASTSEVYGDPLIHPQPEDYYGNVNPVGDRSCYDESKRFAETLTTLYSRQHGIRTRIVRIFNTYGPGMALGDGRAIPAFIVAALTWQALMIQGTGKQTRSFCYVNDLVDGLLRVGSDQTRDTILVNLGNPAEVTMLDTARLVCHLAGAITRFTFVPGSPDDPQRRCPVITRMQQRYNWEPHTPLVDGLSYTISDIRDRLLAASAPSAQFGVTPALVK